MSSLFPKQSAWGEQERLARLAEQRGSEDQLSEGLARQRRVDVEDVDATIARTIDHLAEYDSLLTDPDVNRRTARDAASTRDRREDIIADLTALRDALPL